MEKKLNDLKGFGFNAKNRDHLTDHLAALCVLMDYPLLFTDEEKAQATKKIYPNLKTLFVPWNDVTPEYIIQNYDLFLHAEPWFRKHFYDRFSLLEKKYNKVVRNVHCPHGYSDKIFWLKLAAYEDITLVYGNSMLDMFKNSGVDECLNTYVVTGNYRYRYYLKHQQFFDQYIEEKVLSHFSKKRPTILYAPTCSDGERNTSFLDSNPIFDLLPDDYNLIVKPHPNLEETHGPELYRTMGKYEERKNIVFVKDLTLVYPLLQKADIYIGDKSSVGYDFLAFNRPMFFLDQFYRDVNNDPTIFLNRCGVSIYLEDYHKIYSIIESHLANDKAQFSDIRKKMYQYTFNEDVSDDHLRESILQSYYSPRNPLPQYVVEQMQSRIIKIT